MTSGNHAKKTIDPAAQTTAANYHLLISAVVPRPIAWVSTRGTDGSTNLAPFSFFQGVSADPPCVMISVFETKNSGERKDTLGNIESSGEFVVNIVDDDLVEPMLESAAELARGASEIDTAKLQTFPAERISAPCLTASPVNLECRLLRTVPIGSCVVCFGEIVLVHVREELLDDRGTIDPDRLRPLARLGGSLYARYAGSETLKR